MKPRKHAELIIAYANGADIQMEGVNGEWVDLKYPDWTAPLYRIKPKEYPRSTLHYNDLCRIWNEAHADRSNEGLATKALRVCADEAIICFIESGEMRKYIDKYGVA